MQFESFARDYIVAHPSCTCNDIIKAYTKGKEISLLEEISLRSICQKLKPESK